MNKENPFQNKRRLREKFINLSIPNPAEAAKKLVAALIPLMPEAGYILSFAPLETEIDLWLLNRELCTKRRLVLPRLESDEIAGYAAGDLSTLKISRLGIREPDPENAERIPITALKLVIVPGLAFDSAGYRLGRGKGHYDRFLAILLPEILKIGVGYKEQLSKDPLPREAHDVKMDKLLLF